MTRAAIPVALAFIAGGLCWLAWAEIALLRGTVFWEIRYLTFGVVVIGVLTLAEWLAGRLGPRG